MGSSTGGSGIEGSGIGGSGAGGSGGTGSGIGIGGSSPANSSASTASTGSRDGSYCTTTGHGIGGCTIRDHARCCRVRGHCTVYCID